MGYGGRGNRATVRQQVTPTQYSLLTADALSRRWGVDRSLLRDMMESGAGPRCCYRYRREWYYNLEDVVQWEKRAELAWRKRWGKTRKQAADIVVADASEVIAVPHKKRTVRKVRT